MYLAGFRPDPTVRERLGIAADQLLVTFRPIAHHAVDADDSGDGVQRRLIEPCAAAAGVCVLVVPRTATQRREYASLARRLPSMRILREVIDGPSLICASNLVVCGGGTMLREAAVLGVPAVSIFSGTLGSVDLWLAREGRVTPVHSDEDVRRIRAERRPPYVPPEVSGVVLAQIVQGICDTGEAR